jgi:hypothetical protein
MPQDKNQGEGDRESARRYNEHVKEHIESGTSEQAADRARRDIEGPEAEELSRAEQEGKKRIAEEDPEVTGEADHEGEETTVNEDVHSKR